MKLEIVSVLRYIIRYRNSRLPATGFGGVSPKEDPSADSSDGKIDFLN